MEPAFLTDQPSRFEAVILVVVPKYKRGQANATEYKKNEISDYSMSAKD